MSKSGRRPAPRLRGHYARGATVSEIPGIEVTIPEEGDVPATPAYAILPPGATRGVVVIHEIMGRQPEIDRVVQRFARSGYAAVEPDLFRAQGKFRCIRRTMQA